MEALRKLFPDRGIDYDLEVSIQETDNNLFTLQAHREDLTDAS